jgi:hypothetical protein
MRDLLFSELIIFMDKIIPKKSRNFPETLWNMRNPNKVFGAHDKIIWSI